MATIRFEGLCALAALGLALNGGIARADPLQMTDPEMTVVSSDGGVPCDGGTGLCGIPARPPAPAMPIRHRHRSFAHHASRAHSTATAGTEAPNPILVAVSAGAGSLLRTIEGGAPNCTGSNSWSLLCPGSQLIGISY